MKSEKDMRQSRASSIKTILHTKPHENICSWWCSDVLWYFKKYARHLYLHHTEWVNRTQHKPNGDYVFKSFIKLFGRGGGRGGGGDVGQDYPTENSSKREMKRQTEEMMGKEHQRVDWPWMEYHTWKAENREEWRKLVVKSTVVPQRSARLWDRQDKLFTPRYQNGIQLHRMTLPEDMDFNA